MEMRAREALECYKQRLVGNSGGSLEDQNAIEMQTVQTVFLRFHDFIEN
jgi:hypothetical protein